MSETTDIERFFARFETALKTLDIEGYADIAEEIRNHLEAAAAEGRLDEALAELGDPNDYARAFADEARIERAMVHDNPRMTLGTLAILSTRHAAAAIGLMFTGVLYLFAMAFAAMIPFELIAPELTGLWIEDSREIFVFGLYTSAAELPAEAERLGWMVIPVSAVFALGLFLIGNTVGRLALKLMKPGTSKPRTL
ncbi:MAG: hypothetical protein GYB36_08100 [Alphaproteobacteria bacterium]|nr:hypothetical protein [Alphaproteobacteria bacterium]